MPQTNHFIIAFVDLEKAFDRVPRKVLWWALRSVGVEWAIRIIQGMYTNARSRVRVNGQYSEEFGVGVGVHKGSVLSPLLFILVLEALSREFGTGVSWELLHADDLAVIAETLEECITKLKAWKNGMENRGLRVNMKKAKLMKSGAGHDMLRDSCVFPALSVEVEWEQTLLPVPSANCLSIRHAVVLRAD